MIGDELFRSMVERSPDGYWIFDLDGRTIYANAAIADMYGVTKDEFQRLTVFDTLDDDGKVMFGVHLTFLRQGHVNESEVEAYFVRRDGTAMWVLLRETMLFDEDGHFFGVLHRVSDNTARRRLVDELEERREKLTEAQSVAKIGTFTWSRNQTDPSLGSGLDIFGGHLPVHASVSAFLEGIHPDDRTHVRTAMGAALIGRDAFSFDARVHDGQHYVWTRFRGAVTRNEAGDIVKLAGSHQDVSSIKQAELALLDQVAQNRFMQAVASAANEAATLQEVLLRARTLVLSHDNWAHASAFVPDPDDSSVLIAEEHTDISGDPERAAAELALAYAAASACGNAWSDDQLTIAFPVRFGDVLEAVIVMTSSPPTPRRGLVEDTVRAVAVQLGRVAEREHSQRVLADARDAAMAASRQKSEFLATMSHEIRTPLNGVIGLNDLLLRGELTPEQRRLASGVHLASQSLLSVINDVLDFSKIEAGKLELERLDFEVRPIFEQVAGLHAENARAKDLELIVAAHPDTPEFLSGDPTRFSQVLSNLVANAIKFTESGEVYVRATSSPGPAQDETTLRVEVVDTGIGVDPTKVGTLFHPFTQADASTTRRYGGSGLGLAISKEIVEALGGAIAYAPRPEGGSVFSFTAVFWNTTGDLHDPADDYARMWLEGRRALVVDDNAHNRLILDEQLAWWHLRPVSVASAAAALAALSQASTEGDPFEVVVLDMAMPDRDGLQLARDIRANPAYEQLPLLMLTSISHLDTQELVTAGIAECLIKPTRADTLRGALLVQVAGVAPSPKANPEYAPDVVANHRRVLVVEDNEVNQMVATGLLESLGYDVTCVSHGQEALDVLEDHTFDAVLMDVQMPIMDGHAATRELRERGLTLPVIAMTAAAIEDERQRCLEAGMDDFLTKPVEPAALATVLDQWLDQSSAVGVLVEDDLGEERVGPATLPIDGLDVDRLDMLRDLDPGNTTYLDRAIGNFHVNAVELVDQIGQRLQGGDPDAARQLAHKLSGSALNLGVLNAGAVARELELHSEVNETAGMLALVSQLGSAIAEGRELLSIYQATYRDKAKSS